MLWLESGGVFASGKADFSFSPPDNPKLWVRVEVDGIPTLAVVDTGAPYLVCSLELAAQLKVSDMERLGSAEIRTHSGTIRGGLYRLSLKFIATEGDSVQVEATGVVPDLDQSHWRASPVFLGFQSCLDRLRFAVDPSEEKFYFGPCP
jgi:gag-polyprotein putative aspartyl protease